jgi:hypothetical protein
MALEGSIRGNYSQRESLYTPLDDAEPFLIRRATVCAVLYFLLMPLEKISTVKHEAFSGCTSSLTQTV